MSEDTKPTQRTLKVHVIVKTPLTPNFLRTEDGQCFPIEGVTDEALREIAATWTAELLAKAARRRAEAKEGA